MASPAVLKIDIIADATKALKQMGLVEDKAKGGLGFTKTAKTIAGAVGSAAIIGFGKDAANAAATDAEAQSKLAQTIRNVTGASDDQIASNENWLSSLSKSTAIADDDLRPALDMLVRGFGNTEDAQKALSLATDVSAGTGKDLTQVTEAMMKAANGSTGALGKMGIKTKDAAGHALSLNDIMGSMADTFGGQAAQSADSVAGRMRGANIAMGELQETIGGALLPIMGALAPMLSTVAGFIQDNATWIAPLVAGVLALVAGMKLWAIAQGILNVVMAANPIVLVVLAIAALVAGIVIAYNKVGWFRDFVDAAWDDVVKAFDVLKDAAMKVFNWVRDNWPLLLAILTGPFGAAVLLIVRNWDTIKDGATDVFNWVKDKFEALARFFGGLGTTIGSAITTIVDWIKKPIEAATDVYDAVKEKFNAVVDFLGGLIAKIAGPIGNIVNAIKNPINAVIRAWNGLEFKVPEIDTHIPGVGKIGGQTIGFPDIPTLARGGSVLRTGMALVHEGERFSGVGRGFGGTTVINVNVTSAGLGADSPEIQRAVVNALRGWSSRNGPLDVPIRAGL